LPLKLPFIKDYPRTIMRQLTMKMRKFRDKYAIWIIYIPFLKSSDFSVTVQDIDRTALLKKIFFEKMMN
jgi:hypothetical protein